MATRAATINDPYIRVSHPAPARAVGAVGSCEGGPPRPQLAAQVCHAFTCRMKVAQSAEAKIRLGPSGSLESRTATMPGRLVATSTHWPSPLLWLLLRHWARERSRPCTSRLLSPSYSAARDAISDPDAAGLAATARRCSKTSVYRRISISSF